MPFSRYQIRNEFSLADPELYRAADKDDPEALLEGVAMAGLVGVLRQLGDLAEFAAEIFHDLHEEVMVTATRGHGLLARVQQLESDFPSIERAFLSQTGHSAFFSSSGVGWHPNLRTEQNLITKGDLPRFVMDSYEDCRAPPRLFLLDKFDIAGAGACLKRYTDPSFYKVEASSYEMMSAEAQRDKKTRKTKKKGSQWKNGNTPEPFQLSHVKLHQLLLEERIQNGTCEPARRVKLKKRKSKFPFDMENGKGYMEKVLSSPPEDKLVHEVPLSSGRPGLETFEITMVDHPPLSLTTQDRSPYESPSVDKMVSREHMDNVPENVPETAVSEMPTSSIGFQPGGARSGSEDEEVEEKHISVNGFQAAGGAHYESDDVASEGDDYEDALATMESEIETDAELRAESDPANQSIKQETSDNANVERIQSQSSGSQSASDDESSSIRKKITSFSYSDDTATTSVDSSQAFACIEIPFRPRVSATDSAVPVDQEANSKEITSKDSDSSEMPLNNCVDVNNPEKTEELPVDPEAIIASTSEQGKDERNSDSTLVISHAEEQPFGRFSEELDICDADMNPNAAEEMEFNPDSCSSPKQKLTDDSLEPGVSYSGEDEMEFEDRNTESVALESKVATSAVCDPADEKDDNLSNLEEKTELKDQELELESESESESVTSETKDVDSNENPELGGKEIEFVNSETENLTFVDQKNEEDGLSTAELGLIQNSNGTVGKKESSEKSVISSELDSVPSYDHSNIQFLDGIHNSSPVTENDVYNPSAKTESSEKSVISPELYSVPSASCNHELMDQNETLFVTETTDQNGPQTDVSPDSDLQPGDHELIDQSNAQFLESAPDSPVESESLNQVDHVEKLENASSSLTDSVLVEEKVDQLENASSSLTDSFLVEEKVEQLEHASSSLTDLVLMEEKVDQLENASSSLTESLLVEEKVDQPKLETVDSRENVDREMPFDAYSEPYPMNHGSRCLEKDQEFQDSAISKSLERVSEEPSILNLSQSSINIDFSDQIEYPTAPVFSMLPQLSPPINLEEMPPLPPLPPMQWRMGKPLISKPDSGQHEVNSFPSDFPQIESHPSLDLNEKAGNEKAECEVLPTESSAHTELEDGNSVISSEVKFPEQIVPQPPLNGERSQSVSTSGREIFWPSSGSSPPAGDDERPNGIRPMKVQRSRTPLIDAVAAHDKSKLRKVSERARPLIPKEEERDTLLEQIRAKSFNLKPAVQTRPSIQGPATNLRVAAILEKANAIRQAFAGSDDDDDDDDDGDDGWSDS